MLPAILAALAGATVSGGFGLAGAKMMSDSTRAANDRNEALQREFASQGLRWKVEDAKAAGLHPLAALGASTAVGQPTHVGDHASGDAFARMGQDLSRAITAGSSKSERMMDAAAAATVRGQELSNDGQMLQNQILATRLRLMGQPGTPPPKPESHAPNAADPGSITSVQWSRNKDGSYTLVPSKDIKERIEDNEFLETAWNVRNLAGPAFFGTGEVKLPPLPGQSMSHWEYDAPTMSIRPVRATPTPEPYNSPSHVPRVSRRRK